MNGLISPELFYEKELTKERLNAFIGHRFEGICETYLKELFYKGKMPFFAESLGRWWGNNPILKRQDEIDVLAMDDENALICECKFTKEKFDEKELRNLEESALCIKRKNKSFMIFSKNGVTSGAARKIKGDKSYAVVTMQDLVK